MGFGLGVLRRGLKPEKGKDKIVKDVAGLKASGELVD